MESDCPTPYPPCLLVTPRFTPFFLAYLLSSHTAQAILRGWTRLDRVMILPLDVRDEVFLERAHVEAVSMLDRPMDMVFHCQDEDVRHAGPGVGQEGEDQEDEEGLEAATDLEVSLEYFVSRCREHEEGTVNEVRQGIFQYQHHR